MHVPRVRISRRPLPKGAFSGVPRNLKHRRIFVKRFAPKRNQNPVTLLFICHFAKIKAALVILYCTILCNCTTNPPSPPPHFYSEVQTIVCVWETKPNLCGSKINLFFSLLSAPGYTVPEILYRLYAVNIYPGCARDRPTVELPDRATSTVMGVWEWAILQWAPKVYPAPKVCPF